MIHRYVARLLCPVALFTIACGETSVVGPPSQPGVLVSGPLASVAGDGTVPIFATEADVPFAFLHPEIYSKTNSVAWSGATVISGSTMDYYGNKAAITFDLTVSGTDNAQRNAEAGEARFWPERTILQSDEVSLSVRATCGNAASLNTTHTATVIFDIGSILGVAVRVNLNTTQPGGGGASQDACGEETRTEPAGPNGGGGGGEGCLTCLELPPVTECLVLYHYDLQTGEIFDMTVLFCY